jgi:predicted amidohydrolase
MEYSTLKIAVAQMAPELGNLEANLEKVRAHLEEAKKESAELVVFPELTMSGYTLGDEISKYALTQTHHLFQELLQLSKILPMVIGYAERSPRSRIYNAAALLDNGEIVHIHRKVYLPKAFVSRFSYVMTSGIPQWDIWRPVMMRMYL